MNIYKNYTYIISNTKENKHYIGSRSCSSKITPEQDLGIKYFSSSKNEYFKKDQYINPQNYSYQVINTFELRREAIWHEICLHKIFDVGKNKDFYNSVRQTTVGFSSDKGSTSQIKRQETMSLKNNDGVTIFDSTAKKRSENMKIIIDGKSKYQIAGEKQSKTKNTIGENGLTLAKNASIKTQITKLKPDINGITINQKAAIKLSKTRKEAKLSVGENNPKAKQINIFNSDDEKIFECNGDFGEICRKNNLPFTALQRTYQKETKLYDSPSKYVLSRAKENIIYKGWYARIVQ